MDSCANMYMFGSLILCFSFCRYVIEKVNLVLVGAEGVVESGGIINKVRYSDETFLLFLPTWKARPIRLFYTIV